MDQYIPMLIEPFDTTSDADLQALLQQCQEVKSVYQRVAFAKVPLALIDKLNKFSKIRNLSREPHNEISPHEVLLTVTNLLEEALAQAIKVRKNQPLGQTLLEILQDSQKSRSRFKRAYNSCHLVFHEDQRDIFEDAVEALGPQLILTMIELAEKKRRPDIKYDKAIQILTSKLNKMRKAEHVR